MKGTIFDFLNLAKENPELAKDLVDLARKYDFEFSNAPKELSDDELEGVSGGLTQILLANFNDSVDAQSSDSAYWIKKLADMNDAAEAMGDYYTSLFSSTSSEPTKG